MESDRGGGYIPIAEENQGKLQVLQGRNGSVITPPPHVDSTRDSHATDLGVDFVRGGLKTYIVSFLQVMKLVVCSVYGSPVNANNPIKISKYFMYWHRKSKVGILQEGQ